MSEFFKKPAPASESSEPGVFDGALPRAKVAPTAPVPEAPPPAEPITTEDDSPVVVAAPPVLSAEIWSRVSGLRPDQMAGFLLFTRKQKLEPRPAVDWVRLHLDFLSRPV